MSKLFIYNFNGYTYETTVAFDDTYRALMKEAKEKGEPVSRQIVCGGKVTNEVYHSAGIWLPEE